MNASETTSQISSVVASKAVNIFNEALLDEVKQQEYKNENLRAEKDRVDVEIYRRLLFKAVFKVNAFNFPKERLFDYIYYKYVNARRNSIVDAALAYMPDKDRVGKSTQEIKEILKEKYNYDYDGECESCRFKNGIIVNKLKDRDGTRCVIVDIPKQLKESGRHKKDIECMIFSNNSMGSISSQYNMSM